MFSFVAVEELFLSIFILGLLALYKVLFCSLPFMYGDATVSPSMILYSCNITICFSFWPLLNYLMGREGFG